MVVATLADEALVGEALVAGAEVGETLEVAAVAAAVDRLEAIPTGIALVSAVAMSTLLAVLNVTGVVHPSQPLPNKLPLPVLAALAHSAPVRALALPEVTETEIVIAIAIVVGIGIEIVDATDVEAGAVSEGEAWRAWTRASRRAQIFGELTTSYHVGLFPPVRPKYCLRVQGSLQGQQLALA